MIPSSNVVPLHRGAQIIRIPSRSETPPLGAPERETPPPAPVNLYDGLKVRQSLFAGICDAIADYLTDPRFMVGFYVGTIGTCAAAWLVVFL